ncbi:alpha-E domain-containing protein [Microbacterium karelineae]|uniref:alpha-E domain-containing protein n=1 Tax=Microbacterium karelineae TaxID=2654283 RepID=UPI0012EAEA4D|nr:alpha-E domain-containing protein [Microbacterium karelineae]
MLSRIAESLFWIGRYLERADDTARILDVQTQLLVEDATIDERLSCEHLLAVMGVDGPFDGADRRMILEMLAYGTDSPASIASAVDAARESARRVRETISTDFWAAINATWWTLRRSRSMRPAELFRTARTQAAMIAGVADATMPRDEGWQFYSLGRSIERVDMTARLLSAASLSSEHQVTWPTTLRSCGAYEAFLRAYRGRETDREAAEFLLLDRLFPRSIVYSLAKAEASLATLDAGIARTGVGDEARRLLGRARAELEYSPLGETLADLPLGMERLQRSCATASEVVTRRYFSRAEALSWVGESTL